MTPKYQVEDRVYFYDWPACIRQVEVRAAGFPDYFIEVYGQGTDCTWAQENELELRVEAVTPLELGEQK